MEKQTAVQDLYELMLREGYPERFATLVCRELATEYTATRMMSYIYRRGLAPLEEAADEMLAILAERDRIQDKHINEHAQQTINEFYRMEKPEE